MWPVTDDLAAKLKIVVKEDIDLLADVPRLRQELLDTVLEQDDDAIMAYLDNAE